MIKYTELVDRGKGGFTLIEMLIVIGIMGLLAGVGFSGIQGLRLWLKKSEDRAFFMELQTACRLYYMEHAAWPDCYSLPELALPNPCVEMALAPYMETLVTLEFLEREFPGQSIHVVVDTNRDHWIKGADFSALEVAQRPAELWERAAVYSLGSTGNLVQASWKQ